MYLHNFASAYQAADTGWIYHNMLFVHISCGSFFAWSEWDFVIKQIAVSDTSIFVTKFRIFTCSACGWTSWMYSAVNWTLKIYQVFKFCFIVSVKTSCSVLSLSIEVVMVLSATWGACSLQWSCHFLVKCRSQRTQHTSSFHHVNLIWTQLPLWNEWRVTQ
jgi:hypothetical protein